MSVFYTFIPQLVRLHPPDGHFSLSSEREISHTGKCCERSKERHIFILTFCFVHSPSLPILLPGQTWIHSASIKRLAWKPDAPLCISFPFPLNTPDTKGTKKAIPRHSVSHLLTPQPPLVKHGHHGAHKHKPRVPYLRNQLPSGKQLRPQHQLDLPSPLRPHPLLRLHRREPRYSPPIPFFRPQNSKTPDEKGPTNPNPSELVVSLSTMPFRPAQCCERISMDLLRRVASLSHRLTTADIIAYRQRLSEHDAPRKLYCWDPRCSAFIPPILVHGNSAKCRRCSTKVISPPQFPPFNGQEKKRVFSCSK